MTEKEILKTIYRNLQNGGGYGHMITNVRYPFFQWNIYLTYDQVYIGWQNAGSSANKNTLDDLDWIIRNIFETTPRGFVKRYELRARDLNYMEEAIYDEKEAIA